MTKHIFNKLNLNELRYFVELANHKHFGKAAKAAHISQPTLSVAINKLEAKLGITLFERLQQQLELTEIGKRVLTQTQIILEDLKIIENIVSGADAAQLSMPLHIAGIFTVAPYLFPIIIPQLNKLAPQMPLMVEEDFTENIRVKLRQGEIDLAFLALPFKEPGIVTKVLYHEPFVVLMPKKHPLAKKKSINPSDLKRENLLLLGEGHCFREHVLQVCPHCYGAEAQMANVKGTSLETLRHMVASGLGITLLPSSATQVKHYRNILCTRPFKSNIPKRSIALAWRSSFPRLEVIDVISQAIVKSQLQDICLTPAIG